jgi:hypothetical protein
MKIQNITFLSLVFLTSCSSITRGVAPDLEVIYTKKGKNHAGVVVYNPHGLKQLVSMRRNKAITRVRKVCHPYPYRITQEETVKPSVRSSKYENTNIQLVTGRTVRFIDFNCVKPY